MNVHNGINSKFSKKSLVSLKEEQEQESPCGVDRNWAAQHLGGHHSFTPSVFPGPHTVLGVGDLEMSKTERSLLSQNLTGQEIISHVIIIV